MKRTLLLTLLIVALCVSGSQSWADGVGGSIGPDSWDELWVQYEAGEIQFAITVSEDEMDEADIPMNWTREMIVDWLKIGWLVIEDGAQFAGDSGGDCHLIVRYDSRWCVEGPGPKRCCCSHDVQY